MKFLAVALAFTTAAAGAQAADFCGQWDSTTASNYIIYNNLWGSASATGSQCTGVDGSSGNTIAWHTKWSWTGSPYQVKSFANAALQFTPKKLSSITTIPSVMKYSYTDDNMVADLSYDLFLDPIAGNSTSEYEVMIWLASYGGAGPIGSKVRSGVTLAGHAWDLYDGYNGAMRVFSFVAESNISSFKGDLKAFLKYLVSKYGLSKSLYLNTVECGTEPFTGAGDLTVTQFSVQVQ
ncbi:cell 12A endoglucanase [Sphaerosporella brunnea]|uniref:Cell 12A endoglucanase n=1 Tax=Sphaerosporella brunnea TaxID=1250544 RepID=A0A5J5EBL8_9PEZI|nr:cell 12A endoglucanase [Sphaerosporella brunnea]